VLLPHCIRSGLGIVRVFPLMREMAAFSVFGLSIGFLVGLSGSAAVEAVAAATFTLVGGSVVVFLTRLDDIDRRAASGIVLAACSFILVGLVLGIVTDQQEWLGQKQRLSSLEAVVAEAVSNELAARRERGDEVDLSDLAALLKVTGNSDSLPYLNSETTSTVNTIFQQHSTGFITKQEAFDRLKRVLDSAQ